jgi:glycerol-3-phosphate O-acyltransferase
VIDLCAHLIRLLYTQGYAATLHYDREKLDHVQALAQRQCVVYLPTHKSNLDHLVLQYMLHENGLPPNHTAGGINMNFFPLGPLVRRSGVFFIRRSFKDNPVYKFVLRHYIDFLVEKRFPLEWYIEGGRSRSGKLLPPRFGLLAYVVDAFRRGRCDDVALVPVSIAYDQISDVQDYAAEQQGGAKKRESFGWLVGWIRRLRHRYGTIHIAFGEPLSLLKTLGAPNPEAEPDADEQSLEVQKLAFEVCVRINAVTPITPISLVTLALLGAGNQAQTVPDVMVRLKNLLYDVKRRNLPNTGLSELETPEGVERALEALAENDVVDRFAEGTECVYRIGAERQHAAAYYRNSVIHFFVVPAIAELALLQAAETPAGEDRVAEFWRAAMQLRDLLKFEFFFAEKDVFRGELRRELAERDPEWEAALAAGPEGAQELLRRSKPFNAHRVLRPFLEAYRVVADRLARLDPSQPVEEGPFLDACLGLGHQYHLQRRVHSTSSVSKVLFQTALKLAANRGLLDPGEPELAEWRRVFAQQIRTALRYVDAVDALAASRRAGFID